MKTAILAGIPLNRLGDAQDVARAALFLAAISLLIPPVSRST